MADFVLNGRRRLARVCVGESGELFGPERLHDGVAYFFDDGVPECLVGEHAVHVEQCRTGILEECEQSVLQNIFHSRAPRVHPNAAQCAHETGDDEVAFIEAHVRHHIETDGVVRIKRCKVDDVFAVVLRDEVEQLFGGRAVRVYERDAFPVLDVLNGHIFQHGRFAHAGLADDIYVLASVYRANAKHLTLAARMRRRKIGNATIIVLVIGVHTSSIPLQRPCGICLLNPLLRLVRRLRRSEALLPIA